MAKIKNMGTATMKFKEGIIVDGNAGNTTDSLIVSGTTVFKDHAQMEVNKRMYFDGSSVANGPYIYGNTTALFIDGDDRVTLSMDKDLRILDEDNNAIIHITDKDATDNDVYKEFNDTNIFFSGSIGSVDGTVFGASTFGGDLVSSGTIYAGKGSGLVEGLIVEGDSILSGNVYINLGGDGESLKIVGTLDHDNYIVFEQPAGSNRAYLGLDSGDNLDIVNNSNNDDINFFTTGGGSTKATMVATAGNRVGIGKFGWAGKSEYGHGEAFPRDELDVSGSMRVSENVELMGQSLVVSGTITGRYDDTIPGHALMFKNTEVYFVTTDDDVDNKTMAPDENIFFSGSIGSRTTTTKGTAVFGGDLVVSGNMRLAETVNLGLSGSSFFGIDADDEMHVTAGGVLSYKVKNDGNVEFQTAVTSSHFKVEGSGGQFVAFNEDTVKLKHVNWYSSNDRQYGQGQLWYQQWFGAVEESDSGARGGRRIGFFFHKPNKGASDADGGSGAHPTNTHAFFNLQGMTLQTGSLDITAGTFSVTGSDGNSGAASFEDYIMAELSIAGLDIQNDTNAFTFNCPYDMVFEQMDIYMDTANSTNDLDVDMINLDDSSNVIFDINNIQNSGNTVTSDTSPTNASVSRGDRIRFRIANVSGSPQGCRANVRFRRRI